MKQLVVDKNITALYHFTKVSNLSTILKHGILSISELEKWNMLYDNNDASRLDRRIYGVSCSIMWPNHKMLFVKSRESENDKYVLVKLKPNVLWDLDCLFFKSNAAKKELQQMHDDYFRGVNAFKRLFEYCVYERKRNLDTKAYWPTDVQAEVVVLNQIPVRYIAEIICKDAETMKEVYGLCVCNREICVSRNSSLFDMRPDYKKSYENE